ncbi:hypothetical protein SAMN02799630_03297 [Paenibacillus sp. UNCCL117]|uniref:hypothetical protein n=1 Tax=unclassified Paenibacillus TaxID=185978 RepID=UPI000883E6D0|nr:MULTISPECIES: hypothetical protein [unclassified Paenibacillus]SDD71888.1 hypothetical protein SAMN04488602_112112 [Paenibacillus sp. cl123]SFW45623.1 hypothetical protein SAMN02799630_03297 [Paenibacillus sp. UNCCL117]
MRWIRAIAAAALLAAALVGAALWLVKPAEALDLSYEPLRLQDQAKEMLLKRKFELELSEAEVNSLIKRKLAAQPQVHPEARITGARFTLEDGGLRADVSLLLRERWPVGATLRFACSWEAPYMVVRHTATELRGLSLPASWFSLEPLRLAPDDYLPGLLRAADMSFDSSGVKLRLQLR